MKRGDATGYFLHFSRNEIYRVKEIIFWLYLVITDKINKLETVVCTNNKWLLDYNQIMSKLGKQVQGTIEGDVVLDESSNLNCNTSNNNAFKLLVLPLFSSLPT